jgi:hypothetical protein
MRASFGILEIVNDLEDITRRVLEWKIVNRYACLFSTIMCHLLQVSVAVYAI